MTAQYVAHFMRGLQEGEDSRYPQVLTQSSNQICGVCVCVSCVSYGSCVCRVCVCVLLVLIALATQVVGTCKHFAAYSLEAWKDYDRFMFDVRLTHDPPYMTRAELSRLCFRHDSNKPLGGVLAGHRERLRLR
jgi:hypothetical protein